jgi:integrase
MAKGNLLSAAFVRNVKAPGTYNDGNGLLLVVSDTGAKSWIYRTRWKDKRPEIGLGSFVDTALADAREKAQQIRSAKRNGIDPRVALKDEATRRRSSKPTFAECYPQYIADHEAEWRNAKHKAQWSATLETYADPIIGKLPVDQIELAHIEAVLRPIWETKTETASRLRGRIERVLSWAIVKGYRPAPNPATWRGNLDMLFAQPSKVRKVRHHPALPYAELADFMAKLRTHKSLTARALEFAILTTSRTTEAIGARWDEIDSAVWNVPPERMKAARPHRVPLVPYVEALVEALPRLDEAEFLFPGLREGKHLSNMAMLLFLKRDMGYPGLTVHGFRSTFKDWSSEVGGYDDKLSEAQLAHVIADKTQAAYERGDKFDRRRDLLTAWAAYCGCGQ